MTQDLETQTKQGSHPVRDADGVGGLRPIDSFPLIALRNQADGFTVSGAGGRPPQALWGRTVL